MKTNSIAIAALAVALVGACATTSTTQEAPPQAECSFGCQFVGGLAEIVVSAAFDAMFSRNDASYTPPQPYRAEPRGLVAPRKKHKKGGAQ